MLDHEAFVIIENFIYHVAHRPPKSTGLEQVHVLIPKPKGAS